MGKRFVVTDHQHLALAPAWVEEGDDIFVVPSCPGPLGFRPDGATSSWAWMGTAYVHIAMDGEAVGNDPSWRDIVIA
jgi:hypothetical protein